MLLESRFVVPVEGPVVEDGGVLVEGGRIVATGLAKDLSSADTTDFGNAVIIPAFVNAHTHLELSSLAGRMPPGKDFGAWLSRLTSGFLSKPPGREAVQSAVRDGLVESLAAGVTTLGDITRHPAWTREVVGQSMVRAVSFGEVIAIGRRRSLLMERLGRAVDRAHESERLRVGISPHAPYTVEPDGLRACADRARESAMPLCIHLAESREEERFTRDLEGSLVDCLRDLGVWDEQVPRSGLGPVELAAATGLLTESTLLVHGNYVGEEDIQVIARSGASVVYCPRTHSAFEHPPHQFRLMMASGVNVCMGTDSLASNPSLSVLDELRFLHGKCPDVAPELLLTMGTLSGARALGFDHVVGSLVPGKAADLVVIPLERGEDARGWGAIFESSCQPVQVYREGQPCAETVVAGGK